MGEDMRAVLSVLIGSVFALAGYASLFKPGRTRKQKFLEKARSAGHYTEAEVVDTKRRLGNDESDSSYFRNDRMKVTYAYRVNGITYHKKLEFQSPGLVSIQYPYTVTVYYDPRNPAKSVTREEVQRRADNNKTLGCFGSFILMCLASALVYNLLKLLG